MDYKFAANITPSPQPQTDLKGRRLRKERAPVQPFLWSAALEQRDEFGLLAAGLTRIRLLGRGFKLTKRRVETCPLRRSRLSELRRSGGRMGAHFPSAFACVGLFPGCRTLRRSRCSKEPTLNCSQRPKGGPVRPKRDCVGSPDAAREFES